MTPQGTSTGAKLIKGVGPQPGLDKIRYLHDKCKYKWKFKWVFRGSETSQPGTLPERKGARGAWTMPLHSPLIPQRSKPRTYSTTAQSIRTVYVSQGKMGQEMDDVAPNMEDNMSKAPTGSRKGRGRDPNGKTNGT